MGAVAIIAGIGIGIGGIIKTIGDVQKSQAQAREDKRKAQQLEELSKPGGYYDQELQALHLELLDVEADRQTAGKLLAINSLEITRQGGGLKGQIVAQAGAGNISTTSGSVVKRQDLVTQTVEENLAKTRLQYEDQLRGLAGRAAQDTAQQTMIEFKQNAGTEDAAALRNEADWLNSWGVGLSVAGGIVGTVTSLATLGSNMGLFKGGETTAATTTTSTPSPQASIYNDPYASLGLQKYWQEW